MTEKAYVLIETEVGKTKEVAEAIRKIKGLLSIDAVTGPYDTIVIIEGRTLNEIGELVTSKIHTISGISRTVTCLALKS